MKGVAVTRWLRALLLAVVSFVTGTVAHVSADGLMPGPTALVFLLVLLTCGCASILRRRASAVRVVLLLVGGQTFIHVALTAAAGHRGDPVAAPATPELVYPTPVGRGRLLDQLPHAEPGQLALPSWLTHGVTELTGPHAFMAVAHVVAAALIGLWLAYGEAALFTVLALAAAALLRLLVAVPLHVAPPALPAFDELPVQRALVLLSRRFARRGPPLTA